MKTIAIIAGRKSHGPAGNGIHDYPAQARLIAHGLRTALPGAVAVLVHEDDAWPADGLAGADALVVISDGRDGDLPYAEASHLASPQRIADVEALSRRGGGIVVLHFATFAGEVHADLAKRWCGAHFAWETAGKRDWRSRITWARGTLDLVADHPALRGVGGPPLHEEYYHRLAFHPDAVPLIRQRALPGGADEQVVAWAIQRPDGGRGFGTTMVHSLDSLRHDGLRTLVLNGIAWSAGLVIPEGGLRAPFAERDDVDAALGLAPPPAPIRVAVLAGNAAHRWHNWPETTAALLRAWGDDRRITARVHTDPADLATALTDRDVLVLNWVNWQDPAGLPAAARAGILAFLERGGGLFVHHFANGACHPSLPGAAAGDWPEFRRIVRRVWEHRPIAPGPSAHDRFRAFSVTPRGDHPLVAGLEAFTVEDELYWRQHGDQPITPLLTARSEDTGTDEPLLWTYEYGKARVVQSLLGHSAKTYEVAAMQRLARRCVEWCGRRGSHG